MFGSLTNFENSLFDEIRRIEQVTGDPFGYAPAMGIRPAVIVDAAPEAMNICLFAAGVTRKASMFRFSHRFLLIHFVARVSDISHR